MDKIDERGERVNKRTIQPKELIKNYFLSNDFQHKIEEHKRFVQYMIENPYEIYQNFKLRLTLHGADAEFPEFEGVIGYLVKAIFQTPEIIKCLEMPEYKVLLEQLLHKLLSLQIEGRFNYPYRSTIYCIENLLELLDFYYRNTDESYKDESIPVNEKIGPYYHIFRYRSYMTTFTDSKEYGIPKNIIFPTCANINATSLIKLRCVPILIMGVSNKPVYVDQYLNTPLDFWAHDIQHGKRQIQETLRYYDLFIKHNQYFQRRTLFDIVTEDQFYKYMEDFIKKIIIPKITIQEEDNEETIAKKNIWRLIIFEVVHEKAWPITNLSLCRNIPLRYDEFPVENLTYDEKKNKITSFHYLFADPTTIGNVVGKIRTGFYDKTVKPNEKIIAIKYRTSSFVAKCAKLLMEEIIKCDNIPSNDYFLALATDRHAMQEFKDIKSIDLPDEPIEPQPYPEEENLFDEDMLAITLEPKTNLDDIDEQDSLHKLTEVKDYDSTFEKLEYFKKKYLKYKKKYLDEKASKH